MPVHPIDYERRRKDAFQWGRRGRLDRGLGIDPRRNLYHVRDELAGDAPYPQALCGAPMGEARPCPSHVECPAARACPRCVTLNTLATRQKGRT
jgi:hypothetical protein